MHSYNMFGVNLNIKISSIVVTIYQYLSYIYSMRLTTDRFYYLGNSERIVIAKSLTDFGRVRKIEYHEDGIIKQSFAVESELFKNLSKSKQYFGTTQTEWI